jgi:NTP pyrophosphatase (non-canonical NTP hydrolase)
MEKDLLTIINNYGVLNQLKHFQSEVYELTEAIFDYEYTSHLDCVGLEEKLKEHITEEIADVMVMLEQFKLYYKISSEDITKVFWGKVARQLERIEKEKENEL